MTQQLHLLTVATADLDAVRRLYSDALGWEPHTDVPGEIVFYQVAPGLLLGFFDGEKFDRDTGQAHGGVSGVTLAHNVASREDVAPLVAVMVSGGAVVVKPPRESEFGGIFHALVRDPNGVLWEIAHNPTWSIEPDGAVHL
ncbi:glyoxalase [Serinibacter arcticus]|uniref:Glyoxalase n=1 Tax=Serinibacter arcticus TaxID=1655435 RepID=A0A2U1ZRE5_9MICO|nr:VOC family protein [Serinibacter arcticus]PWD49564.1 glyoxalase [Serinibacter arcticus]